MRRASSSGSPQSTAACISPAAWRRAGGVGRGRTGSRPVPVDDHDRRRPLQDVEQSAQQPRRVVQHDAAALGLGARGEHEQLRAGDVDEADLGEVDVQVAPGRLLAQGAGERARRSASPRARRGRRSAAIARRRGRRPTRRRRRSGGAPRATRRRAPRSPPRSSAGTAPAAAPGPRGCRSRPPGARTRRPRRRRRAPAASSPGSSPPTASPRRGPARAPRPGAGAAPSRVPSQRAISSGKSRNSSCPDRTASRVRREASGPAIQCFSTRPSSPSQPL